MVSESLKRKLVSEIENCELSVIEVSRIYKGSTVSVYRWLVKYSDIYQIIEEKFSSSVQVRSGGEIVIRNAPGSDGSNAALLIVDGRQIDESDFGNINTADIASINVLKDASASVYGSRGGNGVVIVETKRGKSP